MTYVSYFLPQPNPRDIPFVFPSPFAKAVHPLAWQACRLLQEKLPQLVGDAHDFFAPEGGKMLGVLVVRDEHGRVGYLAGFSGMLAGRWEWPGFVSPVFHQADRAAFLPLGEAQLERWGEQVAALQNADDYLALQRELARLLSEQEQEAERMQSYRKKRKAWRDRQREHLTTSSNAEEKAIQLDALAKESQQDKRQWREFVAQWQAKIAQVQQPLLLLEQQIEQLKRQRAAQSKHLQKQVFAGYTLTNRLAETRPLVECFADKQPPGGAGDCAAPKLIHYAVTHRLQPVALAEFWWGARPKDAIRHHGHYYPACRGKCHPILPFMLRGIEVAEREVFGAHFPDDAAPYPVYEDEYLIVVNKPAGLLSAPGKDIMDSVLYRLQQRYPHASGPLLVHRLDMATSGLLLAAKDSATHKTLQRQFMQRTIEKRYVALLAGDLVEESGVVNLPLRVDLDDRPRHMVCHEYGKPAVTRWQVVEREPGQTRVHFYPVTGRTHQLRLHASHPQGLNAPIVGDELYGVKAQRLMLHAERLRFVHPKSGQEVDVIAPAPF